MKIYSIYDKKSVEYGPLMTFPNDIMCIRAMEMDMGNPNSIVGSYPHDFCVVCFGEFDDDNGKFSLKDVPENIYECVNFLKVQEK